VAAVTAKTVREVLVTQASRKSHLSTDESLTYHWLGREFSKQTMEFARPNRSWKLHAWAHARRPFFALADIEASARRKAEGKAPAPISPLALEAVRRIDRLFEIVSGGSDDALHRRLG